MSEESRCQKLSEMLEFEVCFPPSQFDVKITLCRYRSSHLNIFKPIRYLNL